MVQLPESWFIESARLIGQIGEPDFPKQLLDTISNVIAIDQAVVFSFDQALPPTEVASIMSDNKKEQVIDSYVNGCYQLDPWYHAYLNNELNDGFYLLNEFAPDDFYNSQYFFEYYQSIEVEEEAIFIINLSKACQIQISLGLRQSQITPQSTHSFNMIAPLIVECTKQHWGRLSFESDTHRKRQLIVHEHISNVLQTFGSDLLTQREREVALLIIRGYSLKAISGILGIAFGTIKVHCKNLYKKQKINSQAELFSVFLDEIFVNE